MQSSTKHNPVIPGALAVVVGAGASGEAAARLLRQKGAKVRLLERNPDKVGPGLLALASEIGVEIITGPHEPAHFAGASLVVPSPGVPFTILRPLLDAAGSPPMLAEMELAYRYVTEPILAVTGTSGKTTTVSLAAAMLEEAGKKVFLGGNIGTPLSNYVLAGKPADVLVLEASSFQLMGCTTLKPRVGVLLNISPNHLDQHESMHEYVEAKFSLFERQTEEDLALFGASLEDEVPLHAIGGRMEFFTTPETKWETPLMGAHNQLNIEAAYRAVCEFGVSREDAAKAAAAFKPLENRLELVGEWDGVAYVNDTKCTTVSALEVALKSMDRPTLLLVGGVFKGGDLEALIPLLKEKVKAVGMFGKSREIFTKAWEGTVPLFWAATLEEAMRGLRDEAVPGDVILLAPATASFDLYANYAARGADFRRVAELLR
ncbi:MAG: UDP-N-acetylmuramoylalanine--D-glutamate ligase [Desulfovibrio sp.]